MTITINEIQKLPDLVVESNIKIFDYEAKENDNFILELLDINTENAKTFSLLVTKIIIQYQQVSVFEARKNGNYPIIQLHVMKVKHIDEASLDWLKNVNKLSFKFYDSSGDLISDLHFKILDINIVSNILLSHVYSDYIIFDVEELKV